MRLFYLLIVCAGLFVSAANATIVASTSQRDTLAIPFRVLDSLGSDVSLAAGDSVYVAVFSPGGSLVFKDSMAYNDASIVSPLWEDYAGSGSYVYIERVQTLIGNASSRGAYTYVLTVDDNTGADLTTSSSGTFQVVNALFESSLDSASSSMALASEALDSLDAFSLRLAEIIDSINTILSSPSTATVSDNDKQSIAGYVNDTLTAQHGHGSWASSAIGTGAYSTTIVAWDSVHSQPISGVSLAVYNLAQSSLKAVVSSDSDGRGRVNLNAESHIVVATAPGYLFDAYDTVVISGPQSDTVVGRQFNPGFPAFPEQCRVWGYVFDLQGFPLAKGQVTAYLPSGAARVNSLILTPIAVATATDSTGYFYLDLFPSELLQPIGTAYEFSVTQDNGTVLRRRVIVPRSATWQLTW